MNRQEILDKGYKYDKKSKTYYFMHNDRPFHLTKEEVMKLEEPANVKLSDQFKTVNPFQYRFLTGVKPLLLWYFFKYIGERAEVKETIPEFLDGFRQILAMLNNDFNYEELSESLDKLEEYGLINIEWNEKRTKIENISIEDPKELTLKQEDKSKRIEKEMFNQNGEYESLKSDDFII